jgi:hypothetical protein
MPEGGGLRVALPHAGQLGSAAIGGDGELRGGIEQVAGQHRGCREGHAGQFPNKLRASRFF